MQARLHELGCVGPAAYTALRSIAEEQQVILHQHITIELPGGRTVGLGPQLTLPGDQAKLKGLVASLGAGVCLVERQGGVREVERQGGGREVEGGWRGQEQEEGGLTGSESDDESECEEWGGGSDSSGEDDEDGGEPSGGGGGGGGSGGGGGWGGGGGGYRRRGWRSHRAAPAPRPRLPMPSKQQQILNCPFRNPHYMSDSQLYQVLTPLANGIPAVR